MSRIIHTRHSILRVLLASLSLVLIVSLFGVPLSPSFPTQKVLAASGAYTLNWFAADAKLNNGPYLPDYMKLKPAQLPAPAAGLSGGAGRLSGSAVLPNAVAYAPAFIPSNLDAVNSLDPANMGLGQVVPFELEIIVNGSTAPEGGVITATFDWLAKTSSGDNFGFDPSFGVYAAFVDTSDIGTVDPGANAKVDSFTSTTLGVATSNERIEGTFQFSGLDSGDNIIVEIWVVLKSTIPAGTTGNVATSMQSARTGPIAGTGDSINVGNQTVSLLKVHDFLTNQDDVSVVKSDSPDPVNLALTNNLTYTITITNNSSSNTSSGVTANDTLDTNTSLVSAAGAPYTQLGNVLTFDIGILNPGQVVTLTVVVNVSSSATNSDTSSNPETGGTVVPSLYDIYNTIVVTAITSDPTPANNTYYQPTNVLPAPVASPSIGIVKNGLLDLAVVAPSGQANVGDQIHYTFTVTNTGNVPLTNVTVTDNNTGVTGGPISLAPGVSDNSTFTGTYTLTQPDINAGHVDNAAIATGTPPSGPNVTGHNSLSVTIPQSPGIDILKTGLLDMTVVAPSGQVNVGDQIHYTFTVTNTGNVPLTNVTVTDNNTGVTGGPISLAPGVSDNSTFTGTYTLTQADINAGHVDNTANVDGTTPSGTHATDHDSLTVTIPQSPGIDILKTGLLDITAVAPSGQANVGDQIHFTFTVTNTGNVPLTNVTVTDNNTGVTGGPISLAPGVSDNSTFTATYTLTQADINAGQVDNTANVDGTTPSGTHSTDHDSVTITIPQSPGIDILKNGVLDMTVILPNDEANVDDQILYTFTVTNTGNVPLTNVTVTDNNTGVTGGPISLAPGVSDNSTFTATYTLTQADLDAGRVDNLATATGTPPSGPDVADNDSKTVLITPGPAIELVKDGVLDMTVMPPGAQANVGDQIHYTFTVSNTGNVTLYNVTVTDNNTLVTGGPLASLAPGVSDNSTFTSTYTLTQADINTGKVDNLATADGTTQNDTHVTDQHSKTVTIPQDKSIKLVKDGVLDTTVVPPGGQANVGDQIHYTFNVTNTGNVTLYNVTVTDNNTLVAGGPLASLAPGVSDNSTFTGTYTLTQADINAGHVDNTAIATGTPLSGDDVTDQHSKTVTIPQDKSIELIKDGVLDMTVVPPGGQANVGDQIHYTFTVTNTGNVTLTNVTVTDNNTLVTGGPLASLAPGVSDNSTFTGTYTLTQADINAGNVDNLGIATGTPPSGGNVTNQHSKTVTIPQAPNISIIKNGVLDMTEVPPGGQANVGDQIHYIFTVTNTGNVTLTQVTVTDPKVVVAGGPLASLAPGVSDNSTFTGTYTLTQTDINAGKVDNNATAHSNESGPVTGDTTVIITQVPSLSIVKTGTLQMNVVPPNDQANPGDTITYHFTVTNTGNVPLTNVTVTDPKITVSGGPIALAVGASDITTFTGNYTLLQSDINAGKVDNTATAHSNESGPATGTTENPTQVASLSIMKTGILHREIVAPIDRANPGDAITYYFTVTNTGNVPLTGVIVTDPKITVTGGPISLAVGASDTTTFTGTYFLQQSDINAGEVDNTATAYSNESSPANGNSTVNLTQVPGVPGVTNPGIGVMIAILAVVMTLLVLRRRTQQASSK